MDFSVLSRYDDTLASYFVDSLYLWYDTLRMNGDFIGTMVDKNETVNRLRQHIIGESFTNKAVKDAAESFLTLPYFKEFTQDLTPKQVTEFTQHMKRYLFMYRPNAGFEVGSTSRYTGKPEACLLATKEWKSGEQVTCCLGSIAALSEQDDLKLKSEGRDFSVMVSTRKKCSCLFLGPARFMNHDCDSNCEFILIGQNAITFRVQKDIKVGEEMTVFYAEHYFGENNCECLCSSCEIKKQGHFSASDENTTTDTSDSDITIDENAKRRSGRKRKDISYKDYYVPDQVKKSRPDPILPRKVITNNIEPVIMKKKQLFCDKDLDPFRPRNNSIDELATFNDWIDNLSDISDDDEPPPPPPPPPQVIPKCCPQAKEYCTTRKRERLDLCGRCNRHYQIYGLLWPMRKIRKPNGRQKKSNKIISVKSPPLPTPVPTPTPTLMASPSPPINPLLLIASPTPVHSMHVTPPIHVQSSIYAESAMHTSPSIQSVRSLHPLPFKPKPTAVRPTAISSKSTKLTKPRRRPKQTQIQHSTSEPLIISMWPLDKSIPKIHTNNISVEQIKKERALALKLKKKLYPRKEPYKLVGLDAEIKEKQEQLGGLQLENIFLTDLRNRLKKIVSHRCVVVNTSSLPLLEIGGPEQIQEVEEEEEEPLRISDSEECTEDFIDIEENYVPDKPLLNMTKVKPCFKSIPVHRQSVDDGTTEYSHTLGDTVMQHISMTKKNSTILKDAQVANRKSIENLLFAEKDITVKQEPVADSIEFTQPPKNYVFVHHQRKLDDTYHPLDVSKDAKITPKLKVHQHIETPPNKIVFRGSETSNFTEQEYQQVKEEQESLTLETFISLESTSYARPPSLPPPLPLPSQSSSSLSASTPQQSSMKVSFILQPTNESPKVQPCAYTNKTTKLKSRRKSTRKGCPIAPPRKEPLELNKNSFRSKFRDAPPPRTIPVVSSKESTRHCATNSNIGPFVPIEPNNC